MLYLGKAKKLGVRYLETMAGTAKMSREQLTVSQRSADICVLDYTDTFYPQGKDIAGALTPVHEKVTAVKKSISGLVGKMETGGDQLNW